MTNKKDLKTFLALMLWAIIPSIYMLIRMNIVAVSNADINILGQMEWFDLIDEIIVTSLITPLYFLLKPDKANAGKNGAALALSFSIYLVFTVIIAVSIGSITRFMQAEHARTFLTLQAWSMLIYYVCTFVILLFTLHGDYKTIAVLTVSRLVLLSFMDYLLIPKYSDNGAAYSEIVVNSIVAVIAVCLAMRRKHLAFEKMKFDWLKDWAKIGAFTAIQIFLDNFIYAVMICKMVNAVQASGNYWVANNFIWGWLLVPVSSLAEIIKKNDVDRLTVRNTWKYGAGIIVVWAASIPAWNWFISKPMASDADTILNIVFPLIPFYVAYLISAFIDSWFISKGKTAYIAVISFVINIVYYGILYILFKQDVFSESISFVVYMFGGGMAVHCVLSVGLYAFAQRRKKALKA